MHKIQRTHATQGTTSHNRDTGRSQRRQRSVKADKTDTAHTQQHKNVNITVVASECRVEIGWRNLPPSSMRQSWYSIVRRNPIEIVQYVQYRNAPQHNTNANTRLSWLLTTSFNADDCSSCLHYIGYYCQRFAVEHCLFAFLHLPTVLSHRLMPLIQVDGSRCDAWLIDCKWPLRDINSKPAVNEMSGASTKLQLSWNTLVSYNTIGSGLCSITLA